MEYAQSNDFSLVFRMDKYFEETFESVQDRSAAIPPISEAVIARLVNAGPKHGLEFV
jgi:hypothetical protein